MNGKCDKHFGPKYMCGCDGVELDPLFLPKPKKLTKNQVIETLLDALEFYADPEMWGRNVLIGSPDNPDVDYVFEVMDDGGDIAREALKKIGAIK